MENTLLVGLSRQMTLERQMDVVANNVANVNTNGFAKEFRVAQANLQANIVAGKGNTFAYTGAAGTSPLPTFTRGTTTLSL